MKKLASIIKRTSAPLHQTSARQKVVKIFSSLCLFSILFSACTGSPVRSAEAQNAAIETGNTQATTMPEESVVINTAEAQEQDSITQLDESEIQKRIHEISEKYGATGIQVAIVDNGSVVASFAYGWATKETEPMTADHKMRVASISKVVVGMAAMLLQEDGIVDIDASIGDYWGVTAQNPSYPDSPISIRSILSHTSSIISYSDDYSTDYYSIRSRLSNGYRNTEPGNIESRSYNNYAFRVLGSTLEIAAGQCIDSILQEKLFSVMDIDAAFAAGDITETDMLVTLYRENGDIARSVETQKAIHLSDVPGENGAYFAGGLTISANDLAKLIALLASDGSYLGTELLSSASVETMESYIPTPLADGSYQALPLFYATDLYGREGIYYHSGSAFGVFNCISYDSETGDGVVVLTTGANGSADHYDIYNICDEINEYIYRLIA